MSASERGEKGTWKQLLFWDAAGNIDLAESSRWLPANDADAAIILNAQLWPNEMHYVPGGNGGTWYVWDGKCHRPDASAIAGRKIIVFAAHYGIAIDQVRGQIAAMVATSMPGADQKTLQQAAKERWEREGWAEREKYAFGLKRATGHKALMYTLSQAFGTDSEVFNDHHPRLLNCLNGTVDLETGKIRPHDPADMISYCVPASYTPGTGCPEKFGQLLYRMTGYNKEVSAYLARALGYTLLGANPEQVIFFINGPTKSGKTQLLYIVSRVLGALGHESKAELITWVRHGRNARTENSIRGKRFVSITETSRFMAVDEGQLKRITGEPVISVDQHYAKAELKTPVSWLIFVTTNDMPGIANMDDAMQERVIVIPAGPTIPYEQRDKKLAEKILADEADKILSYLIGECVAYHHQHGPQCVDCQIEPGLVQPADVIAETAKYRASQTGAASFIEQCCNRVPEGATGFVEKAQVWPKYLAWAKERAPWDDSPVLEKQELLRQIASLPGIVDQDNGGSIRRFYGITWDETGKQLSEFLRQPGRGGYYDNSASW